MNLWRIIKVASVGKYYRRHAVGIEAKEKSNG